jgi:hypothetical protein
MPLNKPDVTVLLSFSYTFDILWKNAYNGDNE